MIVQVKKYWFASLVCLGRLHCSLSLLETACLTKSYVGCTISWRIVKEIDTPWQNHAHWAQLTYSFLKKGGSKEMVETPTLKTYSRRLKDRSRQCKSFEAGCLIGLVCWEEYWFETKSRVNLLLCCTDIHILHFEISLTWAYATRFYVVPSFFCWNVR